MPSVLKLGIPVLGICYGMQAMALALGGEVGRTGKAEFGKAPLELRPKAVLFRDLPAEQSVLDEPQRLRHRRPGRVRGDRVVRQRTDRRDGVAASAASTPSSSTPRSCTPRPARTS